MVTVLALFVQNVDIIQREVGKMGISERERHIKVLEQFLHDYQEWGEDLELEKTIKYAISSLKTDLKYDLLYEGEDVYLQADMVNMLEELKKEIGEEKQTTEHLHYNDLENAESYNNGIDNCIDTIQARIDKLQEDRQ